ncbi:hypothetical protein J1614_009484, partial [Plenodomus biglobosus]
MSLRGCLLFLVVQCFSSPVQAVVTPGEVVCRYTASTSDTVNYYICQELSDRYGISVNEFFTLNPTVKTACDNVKVHTEYCVRGYVQKAISSDGFCGPSHADTTCLDTDKQCCNSDTWKCGNQLYTACPALVFREHVWDFLTNTLSTENAASRTAISFAVEGGAVAVMPKANVVTALPSVPRTSVNQGTVKLVSKILGPSTDRALVPVLRYRVQEKPVLTALAAVQISISARIRPSETAVAVLASVDPQQHIVLQRVRRILELVLSLMFRLMELVVVRISLNATGQASVTAVVLLDFVVLLPHIALAGVLKATNAKAPRLEIAVAILGCQSNFGDCVIPVGSGELPSSSKVSLDGTCGGSAGLTCGGSTFGNCCSSGGYCGSSVDHCAQGCQKSFSSACLTSNVASLNGDCGVRKGGYTCASGPFNGQCCSSGGFCGTTDTHCKSGW